MNTLFQACRAGLLIATVVITVASGVPLPAQHTGPLEVKRPPIRPPRSEPAPEQRPQLKRPKKAPRPNPDTPESPCPAGYIARPRFDEGEERPPRLRRGAPPEQESSSKEQASSEIECVWVGEPVLREASAREPEAEPAASAGVTGDRFLEAARAKVFEFSKTLPNFLCEETVQRYISKSVPPKWKRQDRLSAEILYIDGKENYRNLKRNGKPLKESPERSGAWSTGEFGSMMQDIFDPATRAEFKKERTTEIGGAEAVVYSYSIRQPNSHWRVSFGGKPVYPAFTGSVWIDTESHRVLRIEMIAKRLPADYPMDVIEMTLDYDKVRIGGTEYLLPTRSEDLSCQRWTRLCRRNEVEFRNYRKFATESTIMTTDSTVTFEGEEKTKKEKTAPKSVPPKQQ